MPRRQPSLNTPAGMSNRRDHASAADAHAQGVLAACSHRSGTDMCGCLRSQGDLP